MIIVKESAQAIFLFGVAATFSLIYSAYQYISLMMNKKLISYTTATIIDTNTVVPEAMKKNNSRWAIVRFRVGEKDYVSSSRIQVSMNACVGDEIRIAYYKDNPSDLFTASLKKAGIFFIIGIVCMAITFYLRGSN